MPGWALKLGDHARRFRALIENAPGGIFALAANGTIAFMSESSRRILGWDPAALLGQDPAYLVHPDDVPGVLARLGAIRAVPGSCETLVYRVRHADGSWRWVEATISNMVDDPDVGTLVFNFQDVTERRQRDAALAEAQRLESIGRLAGAIAHDFNNLLAVIMGAAGVAGEALPADHAARIELGEIERAAERAAALTRQLLAFGRRQVQVLGPVDLNQVVGELREIVHRALGEGIEIVEDLHAAPLPVRVDRSQIDQVIMNLVVNARDAMRGGGRLTLRTLPVELHGDRARDAGLGPGAHVALVVSDTGTGMDEATRSRVFEPFFTTKAAGQGTGLGLATVYGIVAQSGGTITVASAPGRGATFTVYLPRSGPAQPTPPAPRVATHGRPGGRVLVVEDAAPIRAVLARMLAAEGYDVATAADGEAALAALAAHPDIAVVITDVVMPRLDGPALLDRLRASHPTTKLLVMSGYPDDVIASRGELPASATFLAKPFHRSELLAVLRQLLTAP